VNIRNTGKNKKKVEKNKEENKGGKEKIRTLWTFHFPIYFTQPGETILTNVFLKQLQLHQRSRS
jgi:hypothetical protein